MSLITIGLIINLVFCIIIAALGVWGYIRTKRVGLIYLGISFLFYGLAHILALAGLSETAQPVSIAFRVIGYLLTAAGILFLIFKK
jgi:ABC-type glucose/galactose transport system permease subunit